ncbi:MAG: AmmeMemoRadiSam system protein B [bacterium]
MPSVRPPVLSGTWYPGDAGQLTATVNRFLAASTHATPPAGQPVIGVVPHAGYVYSGETAGALYGLLAGSRYDQVFILAPSHRQPVSRIALPAAAAFATPCGEVAVAGDIVATLAAEPEFELNDAAHASEHAVEIQLPFLQQLFDRDLRIVPLLVPSLTPDRRRSAAASLAPWCDGRSLFIVSTDFTHYGEAYGYVPFSDNIPERLQELDGGAVDAILARDATRLLEHGDNTGLTMCGIHATALALSLPLAEDGDATLVAYSRSGDRDHDYSLSVSYAALLLTQPVSVEAADSDAQVPANTAVGNDQPATGDQLTPAERQFLLQLARQVLTATATGEPPPTSDQFAAAAGFSLTPALTEKRGAFVTLTSDGKLRGCIGFIEGISSLAEAVANNAVSAAKCDPRFSPVRPKELPAIQVEISALTPLREVAGPDDIVIGRHGVVISKGPAHSVFLPQVAPEQGWDRDTTLTHLALKAGLPPDGWRAGAQFRVFEAEVFGEESADDFRKDAAEDTE